jgi:hypothetical protein
MMKKLLFLTICLMLVVAVGANAQWKFAKYFPDTTSIKLWPSGINNGIAVDPASRVWIQSYAYASGVDSVGSVKVGVINVYNANGTLYSGIASPIKILTGKDEKGVAVTDTLAGSGYGLQIDMSTGNILSIKPSARIWKIDYKTGRGIVRNLAPIPG